MFVTLLTKKNFVTLPSLLSSAFRIRNEMEHKRGKRNKQKDWNTDAREKLSKTLGKGQKGDCTSFQCLPGAWVNRYTQEASLFHLLCLLIRAQTLEFDINLQISVQGKI